MLPCSPRCNWVAASKPTLPAVFLSVTEFFVHHTQQLTTAAVIWDAKAIRKAITHERQKLMGAQAPPGATA